MEPGRFRPATTISQRVQDVAERLSTHAKAEIYEVLEGIAPGGEKSSFVRLEPLVNDIVSQLNDGFKQAVTKRLLPEACKLLGSRSHNAIPAATAPSWSATQTPPAPPGALFSSSIPSQNSPPYLENDILALGLAPGTGQPLRPDQGPPQDAASAAASSLLLGSTSAAQPPSTPSSSPGGSTGAGPAVGATLHPPESRFAFANALDAARRGLLGGQQQLAPQQASQQQQQQPSQQPPARLSYGGGGGSNSSDAVPVSLTDPLLFLGLGDNSTGGGAGGLAGLVATDVTSNGIGTIATDAFLLGPSGIGGGGRTTSGAGGGSSGLPSPSLHAVRQQASHLSLGGAPSPPPAGAAASGSSGLSYGALPLSIRPGSSLDPGLATPPVSLPGTEPLRSPQPGQYRPQQQHLSQQQQQQQLLLQQQQHQQQQFHSGRLSGPGDLSSPLVPLPLFGGAPGPTLSPGPAGGVVGLSGGGGIAGSQQQAMQRQAAQQQQAVQYVGGGGLGIEGGMYGSGAAANGVSSNPLIVNGNVSHGGAGLGNSGNGQAAAAAAALQYQQQQQQASLSYLQQQQQQYALLQQQQQLQAQSRDGNGYGLVSAVRTALAAAPDGPRASYDGGRPTSAVHTATGVAGGMELPYDFQTLYGSSISAEVQPLFTSERYGGGDGGSLPLRRGGPGALDALSGASAGIASPDYGMYGIASFSGAGGAAAGWTTPRDAVGLAAATAAAGNGGLGVGGGGYGTALYQMPVGVSRGVGVGSSATLMAPSPPLVAASGGGGRSSRSGAASADSRSSSVSTGHGQAPGLQGGAAAAAAAAARRGSAGGTGGAAPPLAVLTPPQQHPSPPSSDASGPSSVASASTGGGGAKTAGVTPSGALASPTGDVGIGLGAICGSMSMAAKLQQVATKPLHSPQAAAVVVTGGGGVRGGKGGAGGQSGVSVCVGGGVKAPADLPGRFRCLPPSVQARIHALTRDNHVVLLKDFDEKVLSKMTLLVDKFGAAECLAMLDRIEEVLKGKAGRLANGPGYLDVSVSTRLDELKQRASGQVTAPEDYARSTLHSRIYAELRDLIARHGFLQWYHFDQGIINMLKKMPNATALERLNELAYHSFKNVDNPKSCIVSIFTTKPKYVTSS